MTETFVGVDLGTSGLKVARFDAAGVLVDSASWELDTVRGPQGEAFQGAAQWTEPLFSWFERTGPATAWSIAGQMNTYSLLSEQGVYSDAITWQDPRRADAVDATASHTSAVARAMLFEQEQPDQWAGSSRMLLPKDVVIAEASGVTVGDRLSWNGVLNSDLSGMAPDLPDTVRQRLPRIAAIDELVPSRFGDLAIGVPDTIGVILGCGLDFSAAYDLSGTSETLAQASDRLVPTHGFRNRVALGGEWMHVGPSSVGGVTVQWVADHLCAGDVSALVTLAAQAVPTASSPFFLPYLMGERAPLWDDDLFGSWQRLRVSHGRSDLAAAVLEGVSFSVRLGLERLAESSGRHASRLIGQGGIFRSPVASALRADALSRDIAVIDDRLSGCRGAAALALASSSGTALEECSQLFASHTTVVEADPRSKELFADRFELWRGLLGE